MKFNKATRSSPLSTVVPSDLATQKSVEAKKTTGAQTTGAQKTAKPEVNKAAMSASLDALEGMQSKTKPLRDESGSQAYSGQPKADASNSPALGGFNLSVPSDLKVVNTIIATVKNIVDQVKAGKLEGPAIDAAIANLPETTREESAAMWKPAGDATRAQFNAAMDQLGEAAPNAKVGSFAASEASVWNHLMEADFKGDTATVAKLGSQLANDFPQSPMAQAYQSYAGGHVAASGDRPAPKAQFSDADQVMGVLSRVAGKGGDGISGAKGSLSDAELLFMRDLVQATADGVELPKPAADVDVGNVMHMCETFSTMGEYGNSQGAIQPDDFILMRDLAQQLEQQA